MCVIGHGGPAPILGHPIRIHLHHNILRLLLCLTHSHRSGTATHARTHAHSHKNTHTHTVTRTLPRTDTRRHDNKSPRNPGQRRQEHRGTARTWCADSTMSATTVCHRRSLSICASSERTRAATAHYPPRRRPRVHVSRHRPRARLRSIDRRMNSNNKYDFAVEAHMNPLVRRNTH